MPLDNIGIIIQRATATDEYYGGKNQQALGEALKRELSSLIDHQTIVA